MRFREAKEMLLVSLPDVLGAAEAIDLSAEMDKQLAELKRDLRWLREGIITPSTIGVLVMDAADFARELWRDADEYEELADLLAEADRLKTAIRVHEAQRKEGMRQLTLPLRVRR